MIKAAAKYLAYFDEAAIGLRRAVCLVFGDNRSRRAATELYGVWHSHCERCGCLLRREAPRSWREISPEDYAEASKRAAEAWSARHSVARGEPVATPAPRRRSRKPSKETHPSPREGYELNYFARKHGITLEHARDIIKRVGNDREELNFAANRLKNSHRQTDKRSQSTK